MLHSKIRILDEEDQDRLNKSYQKTYRLSSGKTVVIYSPPDMNAGMGEDMAFAHFSGCEDYANYEEAVATRFKALKKLSGLERGKRRGRRYKNRQAYLLLMVRIADHYINQCAIHMAHYAHGPAPDKCVH